MVDAAAVAETEIVEHFFSLFIAAKVFDDRNGNNKRQKGTTDVSPQRESGRNGAQERRREAEKSRTKSVKQLNSIY